MTIDDVVRHVAETPGWFLNAMGAIRRDMPHARACPISSLEDAPSSAWMLIADQRNIDEDVASDIVYAADCSDGYPKQISGPLYDPIRDIRRRLLEAARLTEVSE